MDAKTRALAKSYAAAFNGGAGREVLDDLIKRFDDRLSYVKGDPYETAFREGQRSVLITIRNMIAQAKGVPAAAQVSVEDADEE